MNYCLEPPSETPVIHTEIEKRFHNEIINHKNFNVKYDWFVDVKISKKVVPAHVV